MNKIFYLKTCSTCSKILKQLPNLDKFELREIKTQPMTAEELEQLHALAGSYEALFSRTAQLYKERGLKDKTLTEQDYKDLLLEHYTFLKRPVIVSGSKIFVGNKAQTVAEAVEFLK